MEPSTTANCGNPDGLINPLKGICSIQDFLVAILNFVVQLGTIALIVMLVYVGFLFVVAQGNEEKLKNAKSALMWTVIGGLILLGAQAIAMAIQATVGSLQA